MKHFTATVAPCKHKGRMHYGKPTMMHYRVLGQMGAAAEPALELMERHRGGLPRMPPGVKHDFAEFWLNRIKPGAGGATSKGTVAGKTG